MFKLILTLARLARPCCRPATLLALLLAAAGATQAQTLTLAGTGGASTANDVSAYVDKIEIVRVPDGVVMTNALGNPSFEMPVQTGQGYSYNPTGASWNFVTSAGITNNNATWVLPTPLPAGSQLAFLQQTGSINQALTLPAGTYQVRFAATQRNCCAAGGGTGGAKDQGIKVTVGSMQVGTFTPTSTAAYTTFTSTPFTVNNVTNNALAFDGTNDYVSVPASLTTGVTNFTFEAWYNYQPNGNWTRVMDFGTGTNTYLFLTPNVAGVTRFAIRNNGGAEQLLTSSSALPTGWHHLAVTLSKSGSVVTGTLYVDGTAVATNGAMSLTPGDLGTLNQLWLGRSQYADPYLKGSLDEVRIYSAALTQAQVQADMYSTTAAVPASQLAYYNFDQGVAGGTNTGLTTLLDQSGNGRNGTLSNFALTGTTSNWVRSFPTITGIAPTSGPAGTSVTLSGTNLTDATGFAFNGTATTGFATPTSDYTATVAVPAGATTGPVSVGSATLTKYNGPVFTVNGANNALAFDGADDYVVGTNAQLPQGNTARTLEVWVASTTVGRSVLNYGTVATNQRSCITIGGSGVARYVGEGNDLSGTTVITDGKWHHLAATYDGTTLRLYVDGILDATSTPTAFNTTGTAWRLGTRTLVGTTPDEQFNGRLDEVRIYNTALTQAQVQADMYSTTSALPGNQVAYYNVNQGVAGGTNTGVTSLTDQSGKGNTGTLTNFALTGTTSNWVRSFPTITGIAPTSGPVGTGVTVTGTNLTDATGFAFNGTATTGFATPTDDYLATVVTVPAGATTGPVSVGSAALTTYNGPTFTVTTPAPNNALAIDGGNNYVEMANTQTGTGVSNLQAGYTLETWVYLNAVGGNGTGVQSVIRKDGDYNLYIINGTLRTQIWSTPTTLTAADATTTLVAGRWYHVASTWNGTTLLVYVNGVDVSQPTTSSSFGSYTLPLRLGRSSVFNEPLNGRMDETRIYNTPLTAAQIQADMYSTTSAVPASLQAYYNFDQGVAGGTNTGVTSLTDQSGKGNTGTLNNFALTGTTSNWVRSFPTITGLSATTGLSGSSVGITGTNLLDATGFKFNGTAVAPFTTPVGDFATVVTVPAGATTGPVSVSSATLTAYNGPTFTVIADLVVNTVATVPAGLYNSITVNSPGVATLAGNVQVISNTTVGNGATLNDGCFVLSGAGSFTLAAGSTLGICSAQGISAAPEPTGTIQNTGTRAFNMGANYTYNGTVTQTTGSGLPPTVNTLTLSNSAGLGLTNALTATTAAALTTGVLTTGANALTLGSTATLSETTTGYATGTVQTTRALSTAGAGESFGGIGLTLTPSGSTLPGATFVARTTGTARTGVGTSQSVKRAFDIQPAVNAGLNVALALTVRDDERNNIAAANLKLFKSKDNGTTWQPVAGAATAATTTNGVPTYTASVGGISDFSLWTLGDAANPLPVQLTSFTAEAAGPAARLRWNTASETDNDHFEVEASTDGRAFQRLGTVAGHGTTLLPQQYGFTDENIGRYAAALVYYRLRQVDRDGKATYSQVRTVAVAGTGLILYPNPAHGTATLSGAAAGAAVQVRDALGRVVATATADATGTAKLGGLAPGLYVVQTEAASLRLSVE